MTAEELKQAIEQKTGISAALIAGDTAEEAIAQARAVLAYRREQEGQRPKSTKEQFAEWFRNQFGETIPDTASADLDELAEEERVASGGYPRVRDGGQISADNIPDLRPVREQFAEWFRNETAFNPKNTHDLEL